MAQPFFGRGKRAGGLVLGLDRLRLWLRTKSHHVGHLPDRKAGDLDANCAVGGGQCDVEAGNFTVCGIVARIAYPADQLRRKRCIDFHGPVRHRHPQMLRLIARDQFHRPACRQIHHSWMQEIAFCTVPRCRIRQGQRGDPFTIPKGGGLQYAPTWAKFQMRFLRGRDPAQITCFSRRGTTGRDRRDVQRLRCV